MTKKTAYLTKSAFRQALSCPTKLYYLLSDYPKSTDDNEYLKFLAEGGFIIGTLAQLLYPTGVAATRTGDPAKDFEATKERILAGDTVLFEATLLAGRNLALADILERKGNTLNLIEVKSKSFDSKETKSILFRNKKGEIDKDWKEYLYDVTFQSLVLRECFPDLAVKSYLTLVDKSQTVPLDNLPAAFSLKSEGKGSYPKVEILKDRAEVAKGGCILTTLDVSNEVAELSPIVSKLIEQFSPTILQGVKLAPKLCTVCKECEFQGEFTPSGFDECWKGIAKPEHHIFDLFQGTRLKNEGESLFDQLIDEGKVSLFDVPLESLGDGVYGKRQRTQIEFTKSGEEWIDPKLRNFLAEIQYPLHFIDFETTRTAIPFHQGMRPFEQIAFQWSCHTVASRDAAPVHTEWINTEPSFPNFAFAKSLFQNLSPDGTVLTWATHEGSVLSDILKQMEAYGYQDEILKKSLALMVSSKGSQGRLVDMNKLTRDYYFHPEMKGKTSIKKVFPAIWRSNPDIRKLPWFAPYESFEAGEVVDPYKNLPPIIINGADQSVREGTAAMRAYEEMVFGQAAKSPEAKENWRKLLLEYCKLDTLAMVVIWERWERSRG